VKFYQKKKRAPSIIIVSLIDILAILLIFFIVTTTFRRTDPQLQINLPESKNAESAPAHEEPVVLNVLSAEKMTLDNKPVTLSELPQALRDVLLEQPKKSLALRADREAPFGVIVQVLDALRTAGIKNIPAFTQPQTP